MPCENSPMSDENQLTIPPSFIALFVPPGRIKPNASREQIAERYEFCEDLATMMMDSAKTLDDVAAWLDTHSVMRPV